MMTKEKALGLFDYKDGELYWRESGKIAGYINQSKYRIIMIDGKNWRAHRIIYLIHHGFIPEFIDHIDQNKSNNRINNLRAATKSQNMANRGKQYNNTSGFKGVSKLKNYDAYEVCISVNGKKIHLGVFKNPLEASYTYRYAALHYFKEFANV